MHVRTCVHAGTERQNVLGSLRRMRCKEQVSIEIGNAPLGLGYVAVERVQGCASSSGARNAAIPELQGRAHRPTGSCAGVHVHSGHDTAIAREGYVRDVALHTSFHPCSVSICPCMGCHIAVPHLQARLRRVNTSLQTQQPDAFVPQGANVYLVRPAWLLPNSWQAQNFGCCIKDSSHVMLGMLAAGMRHL